MKVGVLFPYRKSNDSRRERNFAYTLRHYGLLTDWCSLKIVVADDPDPNTFNRGRALHEAYLQTESDTDVLIFADGDLIIPINRLLNGIALVHSQIEKVGYVVPFSQVDYLTDDATEMVINQNVSVDHDFPYKEYWKNRSTGGINILTPKAYEQSGGFDPRFLEWGFEDAAFDAQMQTLVGPCVWLDGPSYHLYHHSSRRGGSPQFKQSMFLCDKYRSYMNHEGLMKSIITEAPRNWEKK